MAWLTLAVQQVDRGDPCHDEVGTAVQTGAGNGEDFENEGHLTFLSIRNGVTQMVITVYIPFTVDGQAVADQTYTILANTDYLLGPFPTQWYNQHPGGAVRINTDNAADGTYAAWRLQG